MTENFPTAEAAAAYMDRQSARVRSLSAMTLARVRVIAMTPRTEDAKAWMYSLPKADLITEIIGYEFPIAMQNEAIHVRYHLTGLGGSSACERCHPHRDGLGCDCRIGAAAAAAATEG